MTFLAIVSSPLLLPPSNGVCPVFFVNSAPKKLISFGCHPRMVLPGAVRPTPAFLSSNDAIVRTKIKQTKNYEIKHKNNTSQRTVQTEKYETEFSIK